MSATAPDMPACQRPGFVYAIRDASRATWASIAATLASAALIAIAAWVAVDPCKPGVAIVLLDTGRVLECR